MINVNKFGIISDTHLGSKVEELELLEEYYTIAKKRKIRNVFHCGDVIEGINIYNGQIRDLKLNTIEKQITHVIEDYPKEKRIKTHFILGNHDISSFFDIGNIIKNERKDLKYIGQYYGRVNIGDDILLDMIHPSRKARYTQNDIKPDIITNGHWHTNTQSFQDDIYTLNAGCFSRTTGYLKQKGISSVIGGWFIKAQKENEKMINYISEWITF